MQTALKKYVALLFCCLCFINAQLNAQDNCYNCNIDSLASIVKTTKDVNEKIRSLELLINTRMTAYALAQDTLVLQNIHALIDLSKSNKIDGIDAYKTLLEGLRSYDRKDYRNAQDQLKKAMALFDISHRKMPDLLTILRITFNEVGNQDERLMFYTDKLKYYLLNGPVENTAPCYHSIAGYYLYKADYNLAISNYLKAADIYKNFNERIYRNILAVVANTYAEWGNYEKALENYNITIPLLKAANDTTGLTFVYNCLADINSRTSDFQKSLLYADSAIVVDKNHFAPYTAAAYLQKSFALTGLGKFSESLFNLNHAKQIGDSNQLKIFGAPGSYELDYGYYKYYSALKKYDSAENSLLTAYKNSVAAKSNRLQLKYLKELAMFYEQQKKTAVAFEYNKTFNELTDQLDKDKNRFKIAQYENEVKEIKQHDSLNVLKQQGIVQNAIIKKNNLLLWGSLIAILLITSSLFFVYRQYHMNKKTLLSLRKTQRQLVMSEKMASLGELTAGIAHEIQNPLNFINNFSEVNKELLVEMKDEIEKGNLHEVKTIAGDIIANEEKINHHGKRADAIVKGMLQHSRTTNATKEPTDINKLADEYLRLAYHGLRAKDNSFNATLKTEFDETIGKVNIIPQDIGRVILNLITNAFYAVGEKKKQNPNNYEPTVTVKTSQTPPSGGRGVVVKVTDNGNGIPKNILDKIFQPFFTTKPTGQGTGLGLSLSYDIVKAHGGELKVETNEGEGTEFIIQLPV